MDFRFFDAKDNVPAHIRKAWAAAVDANDPIVVRARIQFNAAQDADAWFNQAWVDKDVPAQRAAIADANKHWAAFKDIRDRFVNNHIME